MSSSSSSFGISAISRVFNDSSTDVRGKVIGIYTFLAIFNIAAWIVALVTFAQAPATQPRGQSRLGFIPKSSSDRPVTL